MCFYIVRKLQKEIVFLKHKALGYRQTKEPKQQRSYFFFKVVLMYLSTF